MVAPVKDVRDKSAIMVCEIKFGAKISPVYSPLNIKVNYFNCKLVCGERLACT